MTPGYAVPALARWAAAALAALLPPAAVPIGIGLMWVLVLRQESRGGAGVALGLTALAVLTNVVLYAGL